MSDAFKDEINDMYREMAKDDDSFHRSMKRARYYLKIASAKDKIERSLCALNVCHELVQAVEVESFPKVKNWIEHLFDVYIINDLNNAKEELTRNERN